MASRGRAWADTRFAVNPLVAGTRQNFDLLLDAPVTDTLTAVRIVGELTAYYVPTTTVADSLSLIDVGIGVGSLESLTVGGAALPDPTAQNQYPPRGWLYVATKHVKQLITTDAGILDFEANFKFDLRAMRKVDKGRLYLTMEQNNILVGGAMVVTGRVRVLCLT